MKEQRKTLIGRLIARFGIANVRKNLKSLKGKALIEKDRDTDNKPIFVMNFKKPKLIGSIFRDGKHMYKVITETDYNGDQLMTGRKII